MDEEAGRPTFDISSFLAFAFQTADPPQPRSSIDEPAEEPKNESAASRGEQDAAGPPEGKTAAGDDESVDLAKYGPPDALTRLNHIVPQTVMSVVEDSVEHVRSQVAAETELHRQREEGKRAHVEGESPMAVDKGKGVEGAPAAPVATQVSSAASDRTDTESFYTPSEGHSTPGDADARSEAEPEEVVVLDNAVEVISIPRPKAVSTSAISPRRRDLLKAVLRKISDADSRRHMVRRSTGALRHSEVRAKLKHAKHVLQHADVTETA